MKFCLAFVLLQLLVFQQTDQGHVSNFTAAAGDPLRGDLASEISMDDGFNMQNTATGFTEGTDQRNGSTASTGLESDVAGKDIFPNVSTSDKDPVTQRPSYFHDEVEGLVVVFVVCIAVAGLFLSPAMNYCRKNYCRMIRAQKQAEMTKTYQELLQHDIV